jgi:hypothetical protein
MRVILRISVLFLLPVAPACVNTGTPAQRTVRAASLAADLLRLSPSVRPSEAKLLALTAVEQSAVLAADFRPIHVAWLNNNLVNSGVSKRGLCWHWRDDLFPHLFALKLRTLDLHLASARRGGVAACLSGRRSPKTVIRGSRYRTISRRILSGRS